MDSGLRYGETSAEWDRIKVLERENRELRQANEILREARHCPPLMVRAQWQRDRRFARWFDRCTEDLGVFYTFATSKGTAGTTILAVLRIGLTVAITCAAFL